MISKNGDEEQARKRVTEINKKNKRGGEIFKILNLLPVSHSGHLPFNLILYQRVFQASCLDFRPDKRKRKLTFHCDLMLQASGTQADNDTCASSLPPVLQQHCVASPHQRNDSYVNFVECCFWASLLRLCCTMKKHTRQLTDTERTIRRGKSTQYYPHAF